MFDEQTRTTLSAEARPAPMRAAAQPKLGRSAPGAADAAPLSIGQELGPYRLLARLGRGAQGDVWKAFRLDAPGELVALKFLRPRLASNPARMAQFRREAERGARLVGPSLLTVYELRETDGYHFMTMLYVDGTPLREVIKCRRAFLAGEDLEEVHELVTASEQEYFIGMTQALGQATRALGRVHDRLIAHRDIKPANILLDKRQKGGVYLCDFGLGRDLAIATPEQMRDGAGTPMYMAPERLLRLTADEVKCDIYSLGVTLYEALTLERPFQIPATITLPALCPFLASAEPARPSDCYPNFPVELAAVIMKAMAREPHRRYDTARELAADLEKFRLRWSFRFGRPSLTEPHWARFSRSRPARVPENTSFSLSSGGGSNSSPTLPLSEVRAPVGEVSTD
jgi:serine/threonine-protein kinase